MSQDGAGQDTTEESEPDVRFTYANERTFLAWNRTALALIATGVAATQLLPEFHIDGGRRILGIPLIALGALVAFTSFRQWRLNERAMRHRRPLPRSHMSLILSVGIAVIAVIAIVLVLVGPEVGRPDDGGRAPVPTNRRSAPSRGTRGSPPNGPSWPGAGPASPCWWPSACWPARCGRSAGPSRSTAIVLVGVGGVIWMVGMRLSRDLHLTMEPHGLDRPAGLRPGDRGHHRSSPSAGLAFAIAADH